MLYRCMNQPHVWGFPCAAVRYTEVFARFCACGTGPRLSSRLSQRLVVTVVPRYSHGGFPDEHFQCCCGPAGLLQAFRPIRSSECSLDTHPVKHTDLEEFVSSVIRDGPGQISFSKDKTNKKQSKDIHKNWRAGNFCKLWDSSGLAPVLTLSVVSQA